MLCPKCNAGNMPGVERCAVCGEPLVVAEMQPVGDQTPVQNNLVLAIISTIVNALCCCLPIGGVVAIIFATQVEGKLARGDREGAIRASNNAKLWSWIGFALAALGLVVWILWAIGLATKSIPGGAG